MNTTNTRHTDFGIMYDQHGERLPDDVIARLLKSQEGASKLERRELRCARCGYYIGDVWGTGDCFVQIKCSKCKGERIQGLSFFRTVEEI
jgi:predicted Zn-ribbon and HTH transcriptional regulator